MKFTHTDNQVKGVFEVFDEKENLMGEIDYIWKDNNIIVVEHTKVKPEYKGQGIAAKLVQYAIEYARQKNLKIIPECTYVLAYFEKTPEVYDLWAR